jgi:hypothetical protein
MYCKECKSCVIETIIRSTPHESAIKAWVCAKTHFIIDEVGTRSCDEPEYLKSLKMPFYVSCSDLPD